MTTYKDKKNIQIEKIKSFAQDNVRENKISLSMHTGTHIDAPSHFLQNGKTIEHTNLETINGPCSVFDLTHVTEKITQQELEKLGIKTQSRVLLKTKNSFLQPTEKFNANFIYLDHSGAQFLAGLGILCVGIDYLGIERDQPNHETHTILLQKDITIIEGLRLGHVEAGAYTLMCLPLHTPNLEASPARALLRREL